MSEREKQKPEEKVKIVIKYIAGEVSMSEAATEAGVDRKTLQRWVMQYKAEGAATFLPGRREHIYSPKLKLQAVQEYLSGMGSQAELSKKYGLRDRRQLRNWLKVYNAHGDFNSVKFSGGGSYMKQGRDTTQEERIQIVKDCLASGKDYGEMALKLQGKLPAGTHMDAAVRGDGRGRSGGPARKEEEGSGAQNRAGESADRD
mgnify:CR=1 FL=1